MAISKPEFLSDDIWASGANAANKQKPHQPKLDSGWVYGEKPPHNEFNWWWELVGKMLVHIQENGVPAWDEGTKYNKGALTIYSNKVWQWIGTTGTSAAQPGVHASWTELPTRADLTEIYNEIANLKTVLNSVICSIDALEGKGLLYQESWNAGTGVLQLNTVTIGNVATGCGDLLN